MASTYDAAAAIAIKLDQTDVGDMRTKEPEEQMTWFRWVPGGDSWVVIVRPAADMTTEELDELTELSRLIEGNPWQPGA